MKKQITSVNVLRGLASLFVCWFHFTNGNSNFLDEGLLKSSGKYGWLGVEMFFVISGFIIPYSLYRGRYKLSKFLIFAKKRLIRIYPAFFASVFIYIFLHFISSLMPFYRDESVEYGFGLILSNLTYFSELLGYSWINPVFWTLAIEIQFYIFCGVLFGLLKNKYYALVIFLLCISANYIFNIQGLFFRFTPLFFLGIFSFLYFCELIKIKEFVVLMLFTVITLYFVLSIPQTVAGVVAITLIFVFNSNSKVLNFLGDISYSLYLIHVPIGGRIINLGVRYADQLYEKIIFIALALFISIVFSYILYRLTELPTKKLSSSIKYYEKS